MARSRTIFRVQVSYLLAFLVIAVLLAVRLPEITEASRVEADFVIESGAPSVTAQEADRLATVLLERSTDLGRSPPVVLLHPHPDQSWQDVIALVDAARRAGITDILFTRLGSAPQVEVLVLNGIPLRRITAETPLPSPAERPDAGRYLAIFPPD